MNDHLVFKRERRAAKIAMHAVPFLMLCMSTGAGAATQDQQLWLQTSANVKLDERWTLSDELVARWGNAKNGLYEVENNLLLGYKIDKIVTVAAGYTHDPQYTGGHFTIMERRAREQVSFDNIGKILGGSITLRMRLEQRWRDGISGTGWRLRPYVKYALPLSKDGKAALVLWHESFINLDRTSFQTQTRFDRMRNNVSVKFPIAGKLGGEIGYLNQYSVVSGGTDKIDHAATASISLSL